ncbi:MAG: zf-HC2 domain-containing protein [Anaerolineae bacterium]|nr:zf-HC2 domain-containing protein [Anaerolineae bacterium]
MDCREIRLNLVAYLDGEVAEGERSAIEAHLASCPACAAALAELRTLRSSLREVVPAGLERVQLSREAAAQIQDRLRRAREPRRLRRLSAQLRLAPAALRAAIALLVVVFLVATAVLGGRPVGVHAQETLVVAPAALRPDTDAALRVVVRQDASAQPIAGARVSVRLQPRGAGEIVLYQGRTDGEGVADVRFRVPSVEGDDARADLIVTARSGWGEDSLRQEVAIQRDWRIYLSSDKPLYQPGQVIYQRVLALDAATGRPAAGRVVRFALFGPDDVQLYDGAARASEYGIAAAEYGLSPAAPPGAYRLIAAIGDTRSERMVTVGRYERPQFRVTLDLDRTYALVGEPVTGRVIAQRFDGVPVRGAAVTLRALLRTPGGPPVAALESRTDAQGSVAFALPPVDAGQVGERVELVLEAAVTSETGRREWTGCVVPLAVGPLAIDVVAEGGVLRPGVENTVYLLVARPDGAPVQAELAVRAGGRSYALQSDAFGIATFGFVPAGDARQVPVEVRARDAEGHTLTHTEELSADRGPAQVLLRLDRAAYEVGETMRVEVLAGDGAVAYVDVVRPEGGQALGAYIVSLRDGRAELAVDVDPAMAGTVAVQAYQVLPGGIVVRDARLAVIDAPRRVAVAIAPDRAPYQAGDRARVTVQTALDGQGVRTAVGVAVVDESVFALEERAPGFAKLYFLLEASLLDLAAQPQGVTLPELVDPPEAQVRAAQDTAARAAWAALPTGELALLRSVAPRSGASRWGGVLAAGLGLALLCVPFALWATVVAWIKRDRLRGDLAPAALRHAALLLVGLSVVVLIPAAALGALGARVVLGAHGSLLVLFALVVAWCAALAFVGIDGWRRRDHVQQTAALLVAAYGALGVALAYLTERSGALGQVAGWAIAALLIPALAALLVLAAGLWLRRRRIVTLILVALVLLTVSATVLAGLVLAPSAPYARAVTDPQRYVGPLSWLTGCSVMQAPEATAAKEMEATKAPVEVEKEVEKEVAVEVTQEVAVEVTQAVATEIAPTAMPLPTALPTPTLASPATPQPAPTRTPVPSATPPPVRPAAPPPPLLGQFVPETLYWAPEAITDRAGRLEIVLQLPDAPATWRLRAVASTLDGEVGDASAAIQVR